MKAILASGNAHKKTEMDRILAPLGIVLLSPQDMGLTMDVEENGLTFEENSFLKAASLVRRSGLPVIADDSGLCVDYLNGAPGIYSARFGGAACESDVDRYRLLLSKMEDVPDEKRTACFVCAITVLWPDGKKISVRGECRGTIAREPSGKNGFGYDPVFIPEGYEVSMAELGEEIKNRISHRAVALSKLNEVLSREVIS